MQQEIHQYYDQLAPDYDKHRFGNSYGRFIDEQERLALDQLIGTRGERQILDMGCGTGRLLSYASHGVDLSKNMIGEAAAKFPQKKLHVAGATNTGFPAQSFDLVFSFHVIMHLNKTKTAALLQEALRILKPGGRFIFDIPSKKRRNLSRRKTSGWHGANDYSIAEIQALISADWILQSHQGLLFFPIHQFPHRIRKPLVKPDRWLGNSALREYCSYLIFELVKR